MTQELGMLITGETQSEDRRAGPRSRPPSHLSAPKPQGEDAVGSNLKLSLFFHFVLLAFFVLKSVVFPGTPKPYQPSLRVDLVGLPDLLKKDLNPTVPSSALETAQPEEAGLKAPPTQDLTQRNRKRIQQLERMAREESERKRKMESALARMKSLAKISSEPKAGTLFKGHQISRGSSVSGDARETGEFSYYDEVRSRLQQNWELPVWLSRQNLSARVVLFIDSKGSIRNFRLILSSGNSQFDEAVKKTVTASQPFPPPPREQAAPLLVHGITVGFPL